MEIRWLENGCAAVGGGGRFHNWGNSLDSLTRVGTILPHPLGKTDKEETAELYCHCDNSQDIFPFHSFWVQSKNCEILN